MIPIIDQSRKLVVGKRLLNAGLRKSQVFVFITFSVQSFEIREPQVQILSHIGPLTSLALLLAAPDPASIDRAAKQLIKEHPDLNVLINNAGIMQPDQAAGKIDDAVLLATVNTNLIGSIRMTSALIEHLKTKDGAVVAYTSSVLGFVPLAVTAVYSSTKAALHSYALSQRFMLRD